MAFNTEPLKQPRRIIIAVSLFLLLGGGAGSIIGVAMAGDEPMPQAGPVNVPEPTVGERGTYTLKAVELPRPGANTEDLRVEDKSATGNFHFEFRAPASVLDGDGNPHRVAVLWFDDETPDTENNWAWDAVENYGVWIDVDDGAYIGQFDQWYDVDERETDDGTQTSYSDSFSSNLITGSRTHHFGQLPVCGLVGGVQGMTVVGGESGGGLPACRNAHDRAKPHGTWSVLGTIDDGDRRMAIVQASANNYRTVMWFEEGIAVPTRIEATTISLFRNDHTLVAELVAHEPGNGLSALDAPPRGASARLDLVDTKGPVLLDDRGLDHPFTATAAHEQAMRMEEAGLAEFMAQHPEAYLVDASYLQFHRTDGERDWYEYEWRFVYRFKDTVHEVNIGRTTEEPAQPSNEQSAIDELLGNNETQPEPEPIPEYYLYGSWDPQAEDYGPWWPRPNNLPTVASMLEHYEGMAHGEAAGLEANYWHWTLLEAHGEPRLIIDAGRWQGTFGADDDEFSYEREWAYLSWEIQDGSQPYRYSQRFGVTSLPGQAPPGMEVQSEARAIIPAKWVLPAQAAAAIGAGAGLVAITYYLFPLLKSGVMGGLFSRVKTDTALDHPKRVKIMDAIRTSPGIHFQAVVRECGLAEGNAQHHLQKMEQVGLIIRKQTGGYTSYFEKGAVDRRVMDAMAEIRSPATQGILQSIAGRPGIRGSELSQQHGLAKGTVSYHVAKLRKAGLVAKGDTRLTELGERVAKSTPAA